MRFDPEIRFHVPGRSRPVVPDSRLWGMPLSGQAHGADRAAEWTVGDYLAAARTFLIQDSGRMVSRAVNRLFGDHGQIYAMAVSLEKHGAFYHPLKITVTAGSVSGSLVLNGAVRDPGLTLIETEYRLLARLADEVVPGYIPRVFGAGTLVTEKGAAGFFLGQWFDGFYEFHVTHTDQGNRIAIWKDDGTHELIPWQQAVNIYEKIAFVLTAYYEIDTGCEIFPWHHAAGDFVADLHGDIRLITVRGKGLLTETASKISDALVEQLFYLLFYFLNLTLCMRLDRLNGTGDTVWLPDRVLDATVTGFRRSLADRETGKPPTTSHAGLSARFTAFVKRFESSQLHEMMIHLLEDRHFSEAEKQLIQNHLGSHCQRIRQILAQM